MTLAIKDLVQKNFEEGEYFFGTPPSEQEINGAERALEVTFPESYADFVRQVGWMELDNACFFGVPGECTAEGSVVRMTQYARHGWGLPKEYIVLYSSEDEVLWCMPSGKQQRGVLAYQTRQRSFAGKVASSLEKLLLDYIGTAGV